MKECIVFHCCIILHCPVILQLAYISRHLGWFHSGAIINKAPMGSHFLWTFLLGTYLHVDLPAQRIRQRGDMGRNGHVTFREAGPSASPPRSQGYRVLVCLLFNYCMWWAMYQLLCKRKPSHCFRRNSDHSRSGVFSRLFPIIGTSILASGIWEKRADPAASTPTAMWKSLARWSRMFANFLYFSPFCQMPGL